jgi:hypothetical protein
MIISLLHFPPSPQTSGEVQGDFWRRAKAWAPIRSLAPASSFTKSQLGVLENSDTKVQTQ